MIPFKDSAQKRKWVFHSDDQIDEKKKIALEKYQNKLYNLKKGKLEKSDFLSVKEQNVIIKKSLVLLNSIAETLDLTFEVTTTAMEFCKRFFISFPTFSVDVPLFCLTCLYFAGKIEDRNIQIEEFVRNVEKHTQLKDISQRRIFNYEMQLFTAVNSSLVFHNPFNSILGYYNDIAVYVRSKNDSENASLRQDLPSFMNRDNFEEAIKFVLTNTNMEFFFFPNVVGLGIVFYLFSEANHENAFMTYFNEKIPKSKKKEILDQITFIKDEIFEAKDEEELENSELQSFRKNSSMKNKKLAKLYYEVVREREKKLAEEKGETDPEVLEQQEKQDLAELKDFLFKNVDE